MIDHLFIPQHIAPVSAPCAIIDERERGACAIATELASARSILVDYASNWRMSAPGRVAIFDGSEAVDLIWEGDAGLFTRIYIERVPVIVPCRGDVLVTHAQ